MPVLQITIKLAAPVELPLLDPAGGHLEIGLYCSDQERGHG
jgi:hypothetical protein